MKCLQHEKRVGNGLKRIRVRGGTVVFNTGGTAALIISTERGG